MELVPPPPQNIRKVIVAKRRLQVAELTLRGYSIEQIAAELREKSPTIAADRRKLLREWKDRAAEAIDEHKSRIIAEIQAQKREAWRAWERSQAEQKRTRQTASPATKGEGTGQMRPTEVSVERREVVGEPRYLELLRGLSQLEAKLLGLLANPAPIVIDNRDQRDQRVLVIGDAGLPADLPWLHRIPAGRAEQGRPLLAPGAAE